MIHPAPHPLAGQIVKVNGDVAPNGYAISELRIEDWADRIFDRPWGAMTGNPACLVYAMRSAGRTPLDDEVVYGKGPDGLGYLMHVCEFSDKAEGGYG